jgi:hypothetical protein
MKVSEYPFPLLGVERAEVDYFEVAHGAFPSRTTKGR